MVWRGSLLVIQALVALTSAGGGFALMFGPSIGSLGITPQPEYLEGSPFDSYLLPGLILLVVVGGTHLVAWLLLLRRQRWADAASAVAGCGILVWIFVQMVVIPFSVLQAVYFGIGLLELVLVLLLQGILDPPRAARPAR
ncbi:hypothetical protein E3T33_06650 [Cryobacterium sp. TMT1-2-1]|uniref:hypothetical protein n=1 Tax=Cryobacterium sp. TMT1-2-1 TaxID=1259232 RepID=UPI001069FB3A|nr:hypothetical protein [Cryobacterium sp. TMT1-2-1]TFD45727.1 hypothetical protein E3T33_06650 [Cryobacterium sp. TMT1-2-1]